MSISDPPACSPCNPSKTPLDGIVSFGLLLPVRARRCQRTLLEINGNVRTGSPYRAQQLSAVRGAALNIAHASAGRRAHHISAPRRD